MNQNKKHKIQRTGNPLRLPITGPIFLVFAVIVIMTFSSNVSAQLPQALGYYFMEGNDGKLALRVISEADAIAAGNGVVKVVLGDGTVGCADLVLPSDTYASEVRIETTYGTMAWRKTVPFAVAVGGPDNDYVKSVIQTYDGGYAVVGYTVSYGEGEDDLFLLKFSSAGLFEWSRVVGGISYEWGYSLIQTSDSGFIVGGVTKTGIPDFDVFLIKFNSTGTVEWSKRLGGEDDDACVSVIQTSDGGFVAAGGTFSYGAGSADLFIMKFDSYGILEWSKVVGGTDGDYMHSFIRTSDGGFAAAGRTEGYGADWLDIFLMKLDSSGAVEWFKTVGGASFDIGESVIQTSDGGYAVVGYTWSYGEGGYDLFLLKFSSAGLFEWSRVVGGISNERGYSLIQTSEGGFLVAGETSSYGEGSNDFFLVKCSSIGTVEWSKTIGGLHDDNCISLIRTSDDGFVAAGQTESYGAGYMDIFLVKFNPDGSSCIGEYVSPTVNDISPSVDSPSPSVSSPSPIINDVSPTVEDVMPEITILCPWAGVCGEFEFAEVTNSTTGDTWMDRNLGASRQATAYNDHIAYGALFQWGRLRDGHECITWTSSTSGTPVTGTTSTNSSSDDPGHSLFILEPNSPYDWRVPQNDDLWQGVTGNNNPCPAGYRLPTSTELDNERLSWSSNNMYGAYNSPLKLVVAGNRHYTNGWLLDVGLGGFYWSSTVSGVYANNLYFNSVEAYMTYSTRSHGLCVHCIKD
ncbi:hypothetical protein JXI42_10210 [bacterium]|nr:hypothetical protein [bacterium]